MRRLLILTAHPRLPTPQRIAAAAVRAGWSVAFDEPGTELPPDPSGAWLLARPGTFSLAPVLRRWRLLVAAGARPLQARRALAIACDQWRTLVAVARSGVRVPPSRLVRRPTELAGALAATAGAGWFVKGRRGSQGTHVEPAAGEAEAIHLGHRHWASGRSFIVQADRSRLGPIERHLVAGDRVVASALALPRAGERRSNAHRGGRFVALEPGAARAAELALAAVRAVGLPFAAVDAIGGEVPELLEVNASPGLEALSLALGRDLGEELVAALPAPASPCDGPARPPICCAVGPAASASRQRGAPEPTRARIDTMRTLVLLPFLTLLATSPGCGPASASASTDGATPAAEGRSQEPAQAQGAAPAENKPVDDKDPIASIKAFIAAQKIDTAKDGWKTRLPKPPQLAFDPAKSYFWRMETNKGTLKIRLMPDVAPMHVSSCIYLNTLGFYDGLKFHRVIKRFMAQGGCPLGNGQGNPGYQMRIEIKPEVRHDKPGIVSTARTPDPNTDGSQFFLCFAPQPGLDNQYTVYGETVDGLDALAKIEECGRARDPAPPTEEIVIVKGTIVVEDAPKK